ncbi:TonB-dependent receptor [Flavobacterium sp.]|uniref:TonB-dependent receptor n=1 Tax=Flavobacterium sp. TaxID=239 RepID=UPI0026210086|nr:TonB-dependent receptor [Flavobacterium sp.]
MKFCYALLLLLCSQVIFSQSASLSGTVVEEANGQPLPGVTVSIKTLNKETISDLNGKFQFRNVPFGSYEVTFRYISFQTKVIQDVTIANAEGVVLDVMMSENSKSLDEIVITAPKLKTESVKLLLLTQKNSASVSDGISAETIKKTPDKNVSDVLKRISGASIQENKFVIIRGLNDRYNTSYLNGAPLPSSEPDRKAFSFNIFPANMIDNLIINKTATPDMPGEFAGGIIQINTKGIPEKDFQTLSIGSGYNTFTTGKKQLYYKGGNTDWIGLDDGTRDLPSGFPGYTAFQNLDYLDRAELAKSYKTDWRIRSKNFAPNLAFQYSAGYHLQLGGKEMGILTAVTYNRTNNYTESISRDFEEQGAGLRPVIYKDYFDKNYNVQTLAGGMANFSLKFNNNNTIAFKNLYSINSDDLVVERTGIPFEATAVNPILIYSTVRWFTSNTIYSGQLVGEHYLPRDKFRINWVVSYNDIQRSIPNLRRNIYTRFKDYQDPSNPNPLDITYTANIANGNIGPDYGGGIFFSENTETSSSAKFDLSQKFNYGSVLCDFKFGIFLQNRNRNFYARQLGYNQLGGVGDLVFDQTLLNLDDDHIFDQQNMGIIAPGVGGFTLYDGTKYFDAYDASSNLRAAFMMMDNTYRKFRFVYGIRIENYHQKLNTKLSETELLKIDVEKMDFLPSANIIFAATKEQNIRLSYSKSLNRPEFRELAPFAFYDFMTRFVTSGNPNLKRAIVDNVDFRYEIYPGKGQILSLSTFYKKFKDPIEIKATVNNREITYDNANSATNYGFELEFRTLLGSLMHSENSILNNLTAFSNLAIIKSKVDVSNLAAVSDTEKERPMQGQSPYVFNAGLQYITTDKDWSVSLNVNRVGNRIAIVGNTEVEPTLWEKSRTFLDFQISKSFLNNKLELKLNGQNILAQDLVFYHNRDLGVSEGTGVKGFFNAVFTGDRDNKNGYNSKEDDLIWSTKYGRTFSLTATYNF